VNDIVGALGIQGIGFGGPDAWGAPWFAAQGYTGIGDTFAATPMHAWDTMYEIRRHLRMQHGRHGIKFGRRFPLVHLAHVGLLPNRGYYQFTNGYTTQFGFNDGSAQGSPHVCSASQPSSSAKPASANESAIIGEVTLSLKTVGSSPPRPR